MRFERAPLFQLAACIAILSFLMGAATAGAVERDERVSKDPRQVHKPFHFKSVGAGKHQSLPSFLKSLGVECESDCCWAWADCYGGEVYCADGEGCGAWCPDGSYAIYDCRAT